MTEAMPIPRETRERAVRRFCRQIASSLIAAMGEIDTDFATIDRRVGKNTGWAKRQIDLLMDGNGCLTLDDLSDFCLAMGCQPSVTLHRLPEPILVEASLPAQEEAP